MGKITEVNMLNKITQYLFNDVERIEIILSLIWKGVVFIAAIKYALIG